jgi:NTP pyrophosphatase (non-canonical NTP hydrolase)
MDAILTKAIEVYGRNHQMLKAIEEMAELTTALLHYLDGNKSTLHDVRSEIADVTIMMLQLTSMFGPAHIEDIAKYKMSRLERRLDMLLLTKTEAKDASITSGDIKD